MELAAVEVLGTRYSVLSTQYASILIGTKLFVFISPAAAVIQT